MWKRDQQQKPASNANQPVTQPPPAATPVAVAPPPPVPPVTVSAPPVETPVKTPLAAVPAPSGSSLRIKGEVSSSEDLVLHGSVEGKVSLPGHVLTIGPRADVTADIVARTVIINGSVTGNISASDRFEIKTGGRIKGNLVCPNVVMNEGAEFTGGIDMRRKPGASDAPFEGDRRAKPAV